MNLKKHFKRLWIPAALCLVLLAGITLGYASSQLPYSEDKKFQRFSQKLFTEEITSNTLNLHYTLAHPENHGIRQAAATLGKISLESHSSLSALENYEALLKSFDYSQLSSKNQITLDMLLLYLHTEQEGRQFHFLGEMLGPNLGIQAQLPVLLAEYTFYDRQDIEDYLNLLEDMDSYYAQILKFEQEKARRGYFMSDATVDRILEQCNAFVKNPDSNYLLNIFHDKLMNFPNLTQEEMNDYQTRHYKAVTDHVIPSYITLMNGLKALKGSGSNPYGLYYYENGPQYYEYLLKSSIGTYDSVKSIENRLCQQLLTDSRELGEILKKDPSLAVSVYQNNFTAKSPSETLKDLEKLCRKDFPPLENVSYEVKYVHDSMEEYLSPAFYLTPPIDTLSPNTIYINQASQTSPLELFTTLAHEGFPGHLYQTLYFGRTEPDDIRYLLNFGGYVEGWATYIESYAYGYADTDPNLTRLMWLNRSINLCLYSLIDIGIHYHGWTPEQVSSYLRNFGITDASIIEEIYQSIVETPSNYLKYYLGYLNFADLKKEVQTKEGKDFSNVKFHKQILEIGPVQFPVLKKHLNLS